MFFVKIRSKMIANYNSQAAAESGKTRIISGINLRTSFNVLAVASVGARLQAPARSGVLHSEIALRAGDFSGC